MEKRKMPQAAAEAVEDEGLAEDSLYPVFQSPWWREPAAILYNYIAGGARTPTELRLWCARNKLVQYVRVAGPKGDRHGGLKDFITQLLEYLEETEQIEMFRNFEGKVTYRVLGRGTGKAPTAPKIEPVKAVVPKPEPDEEEEEDPVILPEAEDEDAWLKLAGPIVRLLKKEPRTASQMTEELQFFKVDGEQLSRKVIESAVDWLLDRGWIEVQRTGSGVKKYKLVAEPIKTEREEEAPPPQPSPAARRLEPEPELEEEEEEIETESETAESEEVEEEVVPEPEIEPELAALQAQDEEEQVEETRKEEPEMARPPKKYTINEAAEYLGMHKVTLYKKRQLGEIKAEQDKDTGEYSFSKIEMDRYLGAQKQAKKSAEPKKEKPVAEPENSSAAGEEDEDHEVPEKPAEKKPRKVVAARRKAKGKGNAGVDIDTVRGKIRHLVGNVDFGIMTAEQALEYIRGLLTPDAEGGNNNAQSAIELVRALVGPSEEV